MDSHQTKLLKSKSKRYIHSQEEDQLHFEL